MDYVPPPQGCFSHLIYTFSLSPEDILDFKQRCSYCQAFLKLFEGHHSTTTFPNTTKYGGLQNQTLKDTCSSKALSEKMFTFQGLASDLPSLSNPGYLIQPFVCRIVPKFPWRQCRMGTITAANKKAQQQKKKIKEKVPKVPI